MRKIANFAGLCKFVLYHSYFFPKIEGNKIASDQTCVCSPILGLPLPNVWLIYRQASTQRWYIYPSVFARE